MNKSLIGVLILLFIGCKKEEAPKPVSTHIPIVYSLQQLSEPPEGEEDEDYTWQEIVLNPTGGALLNASITLSNSDTLISGSTDENGVAELILNATGEYTLSITATGYHSKVLIVMVVDTLTQRTDTLELH